MKLSSNGLDLAQVRGTYDYVAATNGQWGLVGLHLRAMAAAIAFVSKRTGDRLMDELAELEDYPEGRHPHCHFRDLLALPTCAVLWLRRVFIASMSWSCQMMLRSGNSLRASPRASGWGDVVLQAVRRGRARPKIKNQLDDLIERGARMSEASSDLASGPWSAFVASLGVSAKQDFTTGSDFGTGSN
jgi:hypothetical protein